MATHEINWACGNILAWPKSKIWKDIQVAFCTWHADRRERSFLRQRMKPFAFGMCSLLPASLQRHNRQRLCLQSNKSWPHWLGPVKHVGPCTFDRKSKGLYKGNYFNLGCIHCWRVRFGFLPNVKLRIADSFFEVIFRWRFPGFLKPDALHPGLIASLFTSAPAFLLMYYFYSLLFGY